MFVATVAVDLYARKYSDKSERVSIDLGLSDDDAMFAFHKSWYKIANTIAQLTPHRVVVRNVQFSDEDRLTLIAMAAEEARKARESEDSCFVVCKCKCANCGSSPETCKCEITQFYMDDQD